MQPENQDPSEERLDEALANIDEALRLGTPPPVSGTADFSAELAPELSTLETVLHRCRAHRKRRQETPPTQAASALSATAAFGRYQTIRQLGRGGFGLVFLAYDPLLKRRVALKVPREEVLATLELRERFLTEAQAMAQLQHSHLVPIHDYGEHGVICYLVSAFCDHGNLEQWLKHRTSPVSPLAAATLVRDLALAVRYMHDRGILHRDLKPANILFSDPQAATGDLTADDHQAAPTEVAWEPTADGSWPMTAKISDFGLAKVVEGPGGSATASTSLGTPAYMAPEQARGERATLGPPTDVYALGAIFYEVLTGKRPFTGATIDEILKRVVAEMPAPPESRRPGLPWELSRICLKCLAKEQSQRYAAADALARDLDRWLQKQQRSKFIKRWLPIAVAAALAMAATLAGVLAIVLRPGQGASDVDEPWRAAEKELAAGRAAVLVPEVGRPAWYRWPLREGILNDPEEQGRSFSIRAGNELCLLELLADPQCDAYRFSADVQHRQSEFGGEVGIYFFYESFTTAAGQEASFVVYTFNDVKWPLPPANQPPAPRHKAHVYQRSQGAPDGGRVASPLLRSPPFLAAALTKPPYPWHRLIVEVTPTSMECFWDDQSLGTVQRADLLLRNPEFLGKPLSFQHTFPNRGGLGLCARGGWAFFKQVVVEPRPWPRRK